MSYSDAINDDAHRNFLIIPKYNFWNIEQFDEYVIIIDKRYKLSNRKMGLYIKIKAIP